MPDNKIPVEIELTGDGELKIRKLTSALDDFGSSGQRSLGKFSTAFDTMIGFVGGAAVVGAFKSVTNAALGLFNSLVVDGVKAAQEQEDAINQLNTALVASGKYSEGASKGIQDYAASLQSSTKFADEAIVSASALIQSLGRLDQEGLQKGTKAALDLSAALGIDLNSAALIVGKAASGSVGTLGRYGIKIQEGATNAETFARALDGINSRFGGAAEAQVNTYSGAVARLTNSYGENLEQVGNAVIKNQSLINVINTAQGMFLTLSTYLEKNQASFQSLVSNGIVYLIDGMSFALDGIEKVAIGFLKLEQAAVFAKGALTAVAAAATGDFGLIEKIADSTANQITELDKKIKKLEEGDTPIKVIRDGLHDLKAAAEAGLGATNDGASRSAQSLKNAAAATNELTAAQIKQGEAGKTLAESTIAKADPNAEYAAKNEALTAAFEQELIKREEYTAALIAIEAEKNEKVSGLETAKADAIIAENQRLSTESALMNADAIADNQAKLQSILASENLSGKDRTKIKSAYAAQELEIEKQKTAAVQGILTNFATFQNAKTKELQVIGKAAAIVQATISAYQGAALALATVPFPFGFIAAASVAAAGLLQVSNIAGVGLATGITEVPSGYNNDTFPARLSSGERVVDRGTNQDLKAFLSEGGGGASSQILSAILARLNEMELSTVVNVGNRTIVDSVREGLRSGRTLDV